MRINMIPSVNTHSHGLTGNSHINAFVSTNSCSSKGPKKASSALWLKSAKLNLLSYIWWQFLLIWYRIFFWRWSHEMFQGTIFLQAFSLHGFSHARFGFHSLLECKISFSLSFLAHSCTTIQMYKGNLIQSLQTSGSAWQLTTSEHPGSQGTTWNSWNSTEKLSTVQQICPRITAWENHNNWKIVRRSGFKKKQE